MSTQSPAERQQQNARFGFRKANGASTEQNSSDLIQ